MRKQVGNDGWIVRYPVNKSRVVNGDVQYYHTNVYGTLVEPIDNQHVRTYENGDYVIDADQINNVYTFQPGTELYHEIIEKGFIKELSDEEKEKLIDNNKDRHNGYEKLIECTSKNNNDKLMASKEQIKRLNDIGIESESYDLYSLMNLLPESLHKEPEEHWYDPKLLIERVKDGWAVHYGIGGQGKWIQETELIDSVVEMLIWTKENNFIHK